MENVKFSRNGVEFEPTKQELKIVLDDYAKQLGERDKRIADLERQLAEKDKLIGVYAVEHGMLQRKIADLIVKEIKAEDELKRQLAEKDVDLSLARNEIDILKHNLNISQEHDNVMCEEYFKKCKQHNQAKTDFAIEQLEKVKKYADIDFRENCYIDAVGVDKFIDNQIKELRGYENV